ncbi:SulP family inorganic anion transporter [Desulfobotulus sp. H1]|uniref:SulP family inorganic anion transporter n=1 Tax=Desulfobotulus pelophilus TaxID=2823377 RepID=A0ABT3NC31_9BACT|nr:SulP family inorganic anion transporter [Desulfobotulus pelophilus]MCW7755024.1 SulP family inorganic anion transporter [Desulfobotulus pelophilus]
MHFAVFHRITSSCQPEIRMVFSRHYFRSHFMQDLGAGITVGIVALPLAIAFAIASGCTPGQGIFTAIVAGFIISFLGGSRFQIGGPTGAFVAIIASIMAQFGYEGLCVATFMAGMFLFLMGLFGLGQMLKYIPYPVTTGFTSGIALFIFSTQLREGLGIAAKPEGSSFLDHMNHAVSHMGEADPATLGLTLFTILVMVMVRRTIPKIPAHIVGILSASILVCMLDVEVATIGSRFGGIPANLPSFRIPENIWGLIPVMIPSALTIAFLGGIESLLSASVADGMTGKRHNPDTELTAQGLANMASACFGGLPATGAIARTATSIRAGAHSPMAGIFHAITLALSILCLAPLASRIPMACLAGVLIIVAWDMGEIHKFITLLHSPAEDIFVMLVTFILTVFAGLTLAVQVGVVLAALLFMRRMAALAHFDLHPHTPSGDETLPIPGEAIQVYEIEGPFFFGVVNRFLDTFQFLNKPPAILILRMRRVESIDATAAHGLEIAIDRLQAQKTCVFICGLHPKVHKTMQQMQICPKIDEEHFFPSFSQALAAAQAMIQTDKMAHTRAHGETEGLYG